MKVLKAHDLLASVPNDERPEFGIDAVEGRIGNGPTLDFWPAACVAMCDEAGCLDDAKTLADLKEGTQHYVSLVSAEIVQRDAFEVRLREVIDELVEWGDSRRATELQRAGRN